MKWFRVLLSILTLRRFNQCNIVVICVMAGDLDVYFKWVEQTVSQHTLFQIFTTFSFFPPPTFHITTFSSLI